MNAEVIIVSGLPRSGTSLMMQLLSAGGIEVVTDNQRLPDRDNPHGYFEFEPVKKIKQDASWLPEIRGKAVKMVSQLLFDLPASERYRIVFMERDLEEVITSQEKMLARLGRPAVPRAEIAHAFSLHLRRLGQWLAEQQNLTVHRVGFADVIARPAAETARLNEFLAGRLNCNAAIKAIDPSLYRNRTAS
jgi:hypothetical protein